MSRQQCPRGAAGRTAILFSACLGLAACEMPGGAPDPDAVSRGASIYQANCASCHGIAGGGGGPVVAPSLVTLADANGGRFPAQYVVGVVEGHGRNPEFSVVMPEFGGSGMGTGPVVDVAGVDRPVSAPLADLLAYLATIQD